MKRMLCLLLVCGLSLVAAAQESQEGEEASGGNRSEEALEVLKKADEAIRKIDSVRYHSKSTPTGLALNFVKPAEGTIVLSGWSGQLPQKFYSDMKVMGEEPFQLTGGGDGDTFFIIDHKNKKAYEDMDPGVLGSNGNTLRTLAMQEFVHDDPFGQEMSAETLEHLGEETAGGEECHKIRVVYPGGQQESIWFFSKKDYLPRARVRKFNMPQGVGTLELTITKLEIGPKLDPALFKLKLPEGYEQVDDFAP